MAARPTPADPRGAASSRWVLRVLVLGAFAATLWLCGPRAATVLAARFEQAARQSPIVSLDRVGFASRPAWVDPPLLLAMARDIGPWLSDDVPILDEVATCRLRDGLLTVPWVHGVEIERVFPDRFRLRLQLRRPVLAVRAGDGTPLCLVDQDGRALPWADTVLPATLLHREGGAVTMAVQAGEIVGEVRVRAAAAIAREWRDEVAPLVPGCPELLEVDATNLGERWLRGRSYPEIRVTLRRGDGAGVVFAYDRPVGSVLQRVPGPTKARVLGLILQRHPGLRGLVAGDLRLQNRWADYLQPREPGVADPDGPWSALDSPRAGTGR
ncbi:MAG: hypothetical protein FJ265_05095 [Planctomycetes bacterium]|nr:hypothetical protein [Planctomycetota bacterium]